jgi:glutamine amidotransferase
MISIIDYGMGNIGSLENMVRKVGGKVAVVRDPESIRNAAALIMPGVGSFDNAMRRLGESGLEAAINEAVMSRGVPILCICLGAQLATQSSEEGSLPGFGWIKGRTVKFNFPAELGLRVPHMGWNEAFPRRNDGIFKGLEEECSFYFVHSYYLKPDNEENILATTTYGITFCSAMQMDNIFATQFHPEKSHKYGMRLIGNFMEICGNAAH